MTTTKLYAIVKNDVDSMTPGRQAAQACHAASQVAFDFAISYKNGLSRFNKSYMEWADEAAGFGTQIVLQCNSSEFDEMKQMIFDLEEDDVNRFGIIVDPTYPIKDGNTFHLVEFETVIWAFVFEEDPYELNGIEQNLLNSIKKLKLM